MTSIDGESYATVNFKVETKTKPTVCPAIRRVSEHLPSALASVSKSGEARTGIAKSQQNKFYGAA